MRLLLDTQILIWTLIEDDRLSNRARALLTDRDVELYVSAVSIWEIAIKFARRTGGANDMPISPREAASRVSAAQAEWLPVTPEHALTLERLPPRHRDPFDRMLVAQALTEPLRLITTDRVVAGYGDFVELV
jgi:PIN domain nuclease of toxin-antitoxin system